MSLMDHDYIRSSAAGGNSVAQRHFVKYSENENPDLARDMMSICDGFSANDLEREFERCTNTSVDFIASSLWNDEKKRGKRRANKKTPSSASSNQHPHWQDLTMPSANNDIMNLDDRIGYAGISDCLSSQTEDTNSSLRLPYPHTASSHSEDCHSLTAIQNTEGYIASELSFQQKTFDRGTPPYVGASLEDSTVHRTSNGDQIYSENHNWSPNTMYGDESCHNYPSRDYVSDKENTHKAKFFKIKTPRGDFILKGIPLQSNKANVVPDHSETFHTEFNVDSASSGRLPNEVHLLAESVEPHQKSSPADFTTGHQHSQSPYELLYNELFDQEKLPYRHREAREYYLPEEEKIKRQRDLANVRSKVSNKKREERKINMESILLDQEAKHQDLLHLCDSFEAMRMKCHSIYNQYKEVMPPLEHDISEYSDQTNTGGQLYTELPSYS